LKALTLFATHYFELTHLPQIIPGIANIHLDAAEHEDSIVFLHAVNAGPANKSYGLQVAQLAGIPRHVIARARAKLQELESKRDDVALPQETAAFFREVSATKKQQEEHPILQRLKNLDPNNLTPKTALELLYSLKLLLDA
jgi:DNA mismatch repair protein MutS